MRQSKVREVERKMKELENYQSQLMEKGKGAKVEMSPQESQKHTRSRIQGVDVNLSNVKQVSAPWKKKVLLPTLLYQVMHPEVPAALTHYC